MLPGKTFKPQDIIHILRRRFWVALVPFAAIAAGTAVYARWLPDIYQSETLILVVPQRVPEAYVKSTVTTRIEDRLQSITQQILSRTRLERIIQDFNLYAEERRTQIMEDIVDRMRREITVQIVKGDAFRVSFIGDNPRTVMRVTDRLASLFIEENLRDREILAEGTNQFLEAQLEDARRRLIDHDKKLEQYRKQFAGQLPTQLESNMQAITNTEMQIQSVIESLNRDRDRKLNLERQLADVEATTPTEPAAAALPPASDGSLAGATAAQQLASAKTALAALQLRLKGDHPDMIRMTRTVRELEEKANAEELNVPVSAAQESSQGRSPAEQARLRRLDQLRAEIEQADRQITAKQQEETRLRRVAADYKQRVDMVPTRESEMTELTRDYTTLQTMYQNLLSKKEDSKIAANLERRQIGEQFKLLDPARLPEKPFSPNRQQLNMLGLIGGLAIGFALIAGLELRDSSFKSDEDIITVLDLPVLAVVPVMQSTAEQRRAFRLRWVVNVFLAGTVASCLGVVAYTFIR